MKNYYRISLGWRLATILILATIVTTTTFPAIAQPKTPPSSKNSLKIRWKPPIPPSSLGIPGNRAQGGATRGCQPYQGMIALVPLSPQKIAWGQTIVDRPTLWFNAPQGLKANLLLEIALRDQNGQPIAKQSFTTERNIAAGAIGISLPLGTKLQLDRPYRWEVALYCDTEERVDSPLILQGQIQRITPPAQLATAKSPLEMAQILATNGIWYDAISQLGNSLAATKDRELATAWSELLRSASITTSNLGSIVLIRSAD
jgi:Domain of Unknown Function (DUF928)